MNAIPLCVRSKDVDDIVKTVALLAGSFGGVNLEDISAPSCFKIEDELKKRLSIPVMHDDQHGTATVVLAALKNALKLAGKSISKVSIVINGCGAAGSAIAKLLIKAGAKKIVMCDRKGILSEETTEEGTYKRDLALITNRRKIKGKLSAAVKKADVFIGVSAANVLKAEDVAAMNENPIIFAMANPIPEILPEAAKKAGAFIVGTGRSDYPNQINNVLAFPGIFRGALDAEATDITEDMLVAAADAIAGLVGEDELCPEKVVPDAFDERIAKTVAEAVRSVAEKQGIARKSRT